MKSPQENTSIFYFILFFNVLLCYFMLRYITLCYVTLLILLCVSFFFLFSPPLAEPTAYESEQPRDRIEAAAVTYVAAAATWILNPVPDWGANPCLPNNPRHCSWILNPLYHSRNSLFFFIFYFLLLFPQYNFSLSLKKKNEKRKKGVPIMAHWKQMRL